MLLDTIPVGIPPLLSVHQIGQEYQSPSENHHRPKCEERNVVIFRNIINPPCEKVNACYILLFKRCM